MLDVIGAIYMRRVMNQVAGVITEDNKRKNQLAATVIATTFNHIDISYKEFDGSYSLFSEHCDASTWKCDHVMFSWLFTVYRN